LFSGSFLVRRLGYPRASRANGAVVSRCIPADICSPFFAPQALYHAEQAGLDPEPRLVDLIARRATYHWATGRLGTAREGFEKALPMCETLFGEDHPTTIILKARLDTVLSEIAQNN
jgi:hypothetical protein